MAQVLISAPDLQHWIKQNEAPAVKPTTKQGRPPLRLKEARAALARLEAAGIDIKTEKWSSVFERAQKAGYAGSDRTLRRAIGLK